MEHPNLRTALSWCLDEGNGERAEMGLRLAAALGRFWRTRGSSEGREWLESGLAKSGAAPASLRAKILCEAGYIATFHLDPSAIAMLEEALALFKQLGDKTGQALSINLLIHTIGLLANLGRAPTLRNEAEALLEGPLEDPRAAAHLNLTLGEMAILEQDREQVVARMKDALTLFREVGDVRNCAMCLTIMGIAAVGRGDAARAAQAFEEALSLLRKLKDKIGIFYSLAGSAGVAALRGMPTRAARLFGGAEALRKAIGHPAQPLKKINYDYEAYIASTRAELGDTAFDAAFAEGLAMSAEQAVEYALSSEEPAPSTTVSTQTPPAVSLEALTDREIEVTLLVGREFSNRQIASELSISEHTVAAHVRKILKKLGLRSRVQISSQLQ